jgi:hypothetical protein
MTTNINASGGVSRWIAAWLELLESKPAYFPPLSVAEEQGLFYEEYPEIYETEINNSFVLAGRKVLSYALFESSGIDAIRRIRASEFNLGDPETIQHRKKIYYVSTDPLTNEKGLSIAAPADTRNVPFRSSTVEALHLRTNPQTPHQATVVTAYDGTEFRQFVAGPLAGKLKYEGRPFLYIRFQSKKSDDPSKLSMRVPVEHIDYIEAGLGDQNAVGFFNGGPEKGVIILDFLDMFDAWKSSANGIRENYAGLIRTLKTRFLNRKDNRIIIVLKSDPLFLQSAWIPFTRFSSELFPEEQGLFGVSMNPKLMNEKQVSDFLEIDVNDSWLMGNVPRLPQILEQARPFIERSGIAAFKPLPERVFRDLLNHFSLDNNITVKNSKANNLSREEIEPASRAIRHRGGHDLFVFSHDGAVYDLGKQNVYPLFTEKKTSASPSVSASSQTPSQSEIPGIPRAGSVTPRRLAQMLSLVRPQIAGKNFLALSLADLVKLLIEKGEITDDADDYLGAARYRDIFDRSPTLQNVPENILKNHRLLAAFLLTFRDRITLENLQSAGILGNLDFIAPYSFNLFPLRDLANALNIAGRMITVERDSFVTKIARPFEYFEAERHSLEPLFEKIIRGENNVELPINQARYPWLKSSHFALQRSYGKYIKKVGLWVLTDPDFSLRSIYYAHEMSMMVLFSYGNLFDLPENQNYRTALEDSGKTSFSFSRNETLLDKLVLAKTRRAVVETLMEFVAANENKHRYDFAPVKKLVEWNKDALNFSLEEPPESPQSENTQTNPSCAPQTPAVPSNFAPAVSAAPIIGSALFFNPELTAFPPIPLYA